MFIIFIHFYHNFGEAIVVLTFWKMPGIEGQDMQHMLDLLWACRSYSFWVSPSGQAAWTRTSKDIPSSINGLPLDQAHLADSCRFSWWPTPFFRCQKKYHWKEVFFFGGGVHGAHEQAWMMGELCARNPHAVHGLRRKANKELCGGFWSLHIVTSCDGFFWQLRIQFFLLHWLRIIIGTSQARTWQVANQLRAAGGIFDGRGVASLSKGLSN